MEEHPIMRVFLRDFCFYYNKYNKTKNPAFARFLNYGGDGGISRKRACLKHQFIHRRQAARIHCVSALLSAPCIRPRRRSHTSPTCPRGTWVHSIDITKQKTPHLRGFLTMAEMVGFEPTCPSSGQHDFQSCSL